MLEPSEEHTNGVSCAHSETPAIKVVKESEAIAIGIRADYEAMNVL